MPVCAFVGVVSTPSGQTQAFVPALECAGDSFVVSSLAEFSQAKQDALALSARVTALEDAASSLAMPSAADAGTAFGIAFTSVVGCYVIARAAGAVLNFIR